MTAWMTEPMLTVLPITRITRDTTNTGRVASSSDLKKWHPTVKIGRCSRKTRVPGIPPRLLKEKELIYEI